jgi:hypothetical protein
MSYESPRVAGRALPARLSRLVRQCCRRAVSHVRALGFWLTVGLPWLLLGLVFGGYVTSEPVAFVTLSAVAVLCAVVGRNHGNQ